MNLHIYLHSTEYRDGDPVIRKLDQILAKLQSLTLGVTHMSVELDTLAVKVGAIENVGDAAIELLNGIKARLDQAIAANDPAALQALSDRLGAQTDELAAAITLNTPAE